MKERRMFWSDIARDAEQRENARLTGSLTGTRFNYAEVSRLSSRINRETLGQYAHYSLTAMGIFAGIMGEYVHTAYRGFSTGHLLTAAGGIAGDRLGAFVEKKIVGSDSRSN